MLPNPLTGIAAVGASTAGVAFGLTLGAGLAVAAHTALAMEGKR